jgi:FtsP/CotA-like multicopper oxidase with cupredoxin domain
MTKRAQPSPLLDRREFLKLGTAAGLGLVALPGCGQHPGSNDPDPPTMNPSSPPDAFAVPPRDDGELVDGVRLFRLNLQTGQMAWVSGHPTTTYGVNGPYLGPTLRFRSGERVRIEVTNGLEETTTLHWHGIELPAKSDGGPYQPIAPGETWVTEYDVIQRPLTAWYHPHQMHMTARHVYMGIAGLILIEDPSGQTELPSTYGVDDLPLVVQDRLFFADGTHPYSSGNAPTMHQMMSGVRGNTLLVNGMHDARGIVPRALVRLRLLNGSNARIYNFGFEDGRSFTQIASDGGLLSSPIRTSRLLLAPGERAEILVDFGADETGAEVAMNSYSGEVFSRLFAGNMGNMMSDELDRSTFEVMRFEVGDPLTEGVSPPEAFQPIERLKEADATRTRSLLLSMGGGAVAINGAQMTDLDAVPDAISFRIPLGSVEVWEIIGSGGMAHPMHIHNRHFQVLDIDGHPPPPELSGWKDTVIVEPEQVVRVIVDHQGTPDPDYPYMFHCHILEHEDMGMMGQFFIVDL